jgi:hypothetical protein
VRSLGRGAGDSSSSPSDEPLLGGSSEDPLDFDDDQEQAVNSRNYNSVTDESIMDLEQGNIDPDRTR